MGYVYRGRALVCDGCTAVPAQLRECPYRVTVPGGQRVRYCKPSLAVDVEDFAEQARTQLGETADASIEAERRDRAERQGRLF